MLTVSGLNFPERSIFQQTVFEVAGQTYSWQDVFASAKLSGRWKTLENRVAGGIACQKKMQDLNEQIHDEEFERAGEDFRYERDLVAAEEFEAWLEKRELTIEEWTDFLERKLLLERWSEELQEILAEYPVSKEEILEDMEVDGICSGDFQSFAVELAGLAALQSSDKRVKIKDAEVRQFLESIPEETSRYPGIETLVGLKLGFHHFREEISEEMIRERIRSGALDFIRFRLRCLTFENREQASEAALCVTEDGETFAQVSAMAGVVLQEEVCYLEDLDSEIRNALAGAQPDEFIGPLKKSNGQYMVVHVKAKQAASPNDPEIRQKAKEKLAQSVLNYEMNNRVRWHGQLYP